MLKSLKNEKLKKTLSKQNTLNSQRNKPILYVKVNREIMKEKMITNFKNKIELELIEKYFKKLKFFHNCIKLKKNVRLHKKSLSFNLLREFRKVSRKINQSITKRIQKIQKRKTFYELTKGTKILSYKKEFRREFLVTNTLRLLNIVRDEININKFLLSKKIIFFYFLVSEKLKKTIENKITINEKMRNFENIKRNIYKIEFVNKLYKNFNSRIKKNFTFNKFYRMLFLTKAREKIKNKNNVEELKKSFRLRINFKNLILKINNLSNFKNKNKIAENYFNDKLKIKLFERMNYKRFIIDKFKFFIKEYLISIKNKNRDVLMSIHKKGKQDLEALKKKYKDSKNIKLIKLKKQFLNLIREKINSKIKNRIAEDYQKEKLNKKTFLILQKHSKKRKFLNMFIKKFRSIHNQVLSKNYIDLMKYKFHKQNKFNVCKMPHLIKWKTKMKFEKKLILLSLNKIKTFFRKCKKTIKLKKQIKKKIKIAEYFYHKKLMIKSFAGFTKIKTYLTIKQKSQILNKKRFADFIRNFNRNNLILDKQAVLYKNHLKRKFGFILYMLIILLKTNFERENSLTYKQVRKRDELFIKMKGQLKISNIMKNGMLLNIMNILILFNKIKFGCKQSKLNLFIFRNLQHFESQ